MYELPQPFPPLRDSSPIRLQPHIKRCHFQKEYKESDSLCALKQSHFKVCAFILLEGCKNWLISQPGLDLFYLTIPHEEDMV